MSSPAVASPYRPYPTSKRTNSLGWAKSPCHNCSSLGRACDRRRPRCDACTAEGVVCGGYVQKLDWQRGVVRTGKRGQRVKEYVPQEQSLPTPSTLTFVQEAGYTRKSGKRRKSAPDVQRQRRQETESSSEQPESPVVSETAQREEDASEQSVVLRRHSEPGVRLKTPPSPPISNPYQLPASVRESISFFEWRFAFVTLTFDVSVNPWQSCLPMLHETPCLMDAVTALSRRHQAHLENRQEDLGVLELKDRALRSFASQLNDLPCETTISTSLLLFALDYAETGFSHWKVHLSGALRAMEARGGIASAKFKMGLRCQIAMLLWYDVTAALMSRSGPIFPRSYAETLMTWRIDSEWTLLALNGCPDTLFLDMWDIADAAAREDSLNEGETAVLEMRLWVANSDAKSNKQIATLTEIWRLGLLLYCSRLFHPIDTNHEHIKALANDTLHLISQLPSDSPTQKQCLLPVTLAGCEMESQEGRKVALDFCTRWKATTGIWIFSSARELLEKTWALMDQRGPESTWWGLLVPQKAIQGYMLG